MIDAAIPLQVNQPKQPENALAGLAQIAQIKSATLQNALVTQEIQQRAVQAQQAQYQQSAFLAGQQALRQSVDPATGLPDFGKASKLLAGQYPDISAEFAKQGDAMAVSHANAQSTVVDATQKLNKHVADVLGPSVQSGDQNAYIAALSSLSTQPGPIGQIAQQAPKDVNQAKPLLAQWTGLGTQLAQAKETADANKANADARLAGTSADIKKKELDSLSESPADSALRLAAIVDPNKFPDRFKSYLTQYTSAPTAELRNAVLTKAQEEAQSTSPTVQSTKIAQDVQKQRALLPGEINKAVATENATIGSKVATAVQTARALYGGNTADVADVAPKDIIPYKQSLQKAGTELVTATGAANEMASMVDAMRSGNKVAYSYAPVTGVLTINSANGTKRINMAEIEKYGASGSALDRVKGWLGKNLEGKGIPEGIVNDMDSLHQNLYKVAQDNYRNSVTNSNNTYHGGADPENLLKQVRTTRQNPATSGSGPQEVTTKAQFDALPSGTIYLENGKPFKKP